MKNVLLNINRIGQVQLSLVDPLVALFCTHPFKLYFDHIEVIGVWIPKPLTSSIGRLSLLYQRTLYLNIYLSFNVSTSPRSRVKAQGRGRPLDGEHFKLNKSWNSLTATMGASTTIKK
uniref:Uncharacterized protein n=1 Tax=Cacopsylla melanoneura TaxID=428564 RepID=A0A8D8SMR2_9HEMI